MWSWYGRDLTQILQAASHLWQGILTLSVSFVVLALYFHEVRKNRKLKRQVMRKPITKKRDPLPITKEMPKLERERMEIEMTRLLQGPPESGNDPTPFK